MRWLKGILILCILASLLVAAIKEVHFRQQELESVQAPQKPARSVHTAKISTDTLQVTQTYRGIVRPERTVALAPRIQGRIVYIRGDAGDEIQAGQTLVRIDDAELQQSMQSLQAERQRLQSRIWILEKTYRRHKKLLQQGNLPQHELDRTLSSLEQARFSLAKTNHQLKQAKIRRDYARMKAEFSGRIQERLQEPGDTAQPGKPVLILEDGSAGYNVHVLVPAEVHRTLQPGQEVVLKDGKRQQKAAIHRLHPASSRGSSLMEIEIFVPNPPFGLASGASLSTELIVSSVTGLVVPERAVLSQDTGSWVFVLDGHNHIRPRQVEILARSSGRVAVKGQLQSGQEVAVGALSELMRLSPGLVAQPAGDGQS